MDLNITAMNNMSPQQMLAHSHNIVSLPPIILGFIMFHLIFLIMGVGLIDKSKSGLGKFFLIFFSSLIINLAIVLVLIFSPNTSQFIFDLFR